MPGLWLLAPGNQAFWQLPLEQNFPIEKELDPALSPLMPMRKCLKQLQAGTTKTRKQICISDFVIIHSQKVTELACHSQPLHLGVSEVSVKNHS